MACKTYKELYEDNKSYITSEADFKELVKLAREMEFADKVDTYEKHKLEVLDTLNAARPYLNRKRIELVDLQPTDTGYDVKYKYFTTDKIYESKIGEYGPFTFGEDIAFNMAARELNRLYSDKDFINEGRVGYDEVVVDMLNEPEKIIELAEEIADIDVVKERPADKKILMGNLEVAVEHLKTLTPELVVKLDKNAKKTGGILDTSKGFEIYTAIGKDNRNKSALEVYVHEMYHAITKFAIESKDAKIARELSEIRRIKNQLLDMDGIKEELVKMMPDKELAEGQVEAMLDYFADEKVGLHEFVAYAMTNPAVIHVLKRTKLDKRKEEHPDLASKLVSVIRNLFDKVKGYVTRSESTDMYTEMARLVTAVASANNRQLEAKRRSTMERIVGVFDVAENKVKDFVEKKSDKIKRRPMPQTKGKGVLSNAAYFGKLAARAVVDENAKRYLELGMNMMGLQPEGTVMTTIRDASESDPTQDMAERFGLISQNIDQYKEFVFTQVALELKKGFDRELTEAESIALTEMVLDTDLSTVWYDTDIAKVLENEKALGQEIEKRRNELEQLVDKGTYNNYMHQTKGLGHFMVAGQVSVEQLFNAHNIARKLNSAQPIETPDPKAERLIDELATLYAIKESKPESKRTVAKLLKEQENGVDLFVRYQEAHKDKTEDTLFSMPADKMKIIKGYSKEIFSPDIDFQIMPKSEARRMRQAGYKLVENVELGRNKYDSNGVEMGMFISTTQVRPNLHRVALRYTDTARRGTSLYDGHAMSKNPLGKDLAKRDVARLNKKVRDILEQVEKKEYKAEQSTYGLAPVFNNAGQIVDYRYMMNKQQKIDLLKMDRRAINVLGRTYSSTYDKEQTLKYNEEIMKFIEQDAEKNARKNTNIGRNNKLYVKIEKHSSNDEVKDIWSVLPDSIKKKHPDGFVVRRDLMHGLLGYRELTLAEMGPMKQLPEMMKHAVRVAEHIWKEIVKIAKVDIVLRVPTVLIGNVTSNMMYSLMSGYSPIEIAKLQLRGVAELNEFMAKTKEIIRLEALVKAGKGTKTTKRKVKALKNDLETSSVKELIDEGFYMTIIEELGLEEFQASNKFTELLEEKTEGMPTILRDGINLLYLNERTTIFKTMNMATQYSDFVARYAQYHLMVRKGADKEVAVKTVRDAFINYNKPNSRMVEWLNQMGFIMFTKYFTRVQKAIKGLGKDHPIKLITALLGQEYVLGDVEDITDQSMFSKDLGNMLYNPLDNFIRAITPSGAEAVGEVLSWGTTR